MSVHSLTMSIHYLSIFTRYLSSYVYSLCIYLEHSLHYQSIYSLSTYVYSLSKFTHNLCLLLFLSFFLSIMYLCVYVPVCIYINPFKSIYLNFIIINEPKNSAFFFFYDDRFFTKCE